MGRQESKRNEQQLAGDKEREPLEGQPGVAQRMIHGEKSQPVQLSPIQNRRSCDLLLKNKPDPM
jgi:hypothetical protein